MNARWSLALVISCPLVALGVVGAACTRSGKTKSDTDARVPEVPSPAPAAASPHPQEDDPPLFLESCEQAKRYPHLVLPRDVRFVDCGREITSRGEAFSLGDPIFAPLPGPVAQDARWYAPGRCEHAGGSITEFNLFYRPEHLDAAIACSKQRCEANDALGCRDLGALHSSDILKAIKRNEATAAAAFERGCRLGDGTSCLHRASMHDDRHQPDKALEMFIAGCKAKRLDTVACLSAGERLSKAGEERDSHEFLLRACRGTTHKRSLYSARRLGCGLLARTAEKGGDATSQREYLRLECAYGGAAPSACEQLGLLLLHEGDEQRAIPYLRKACGYVQGKFERACVELRKRSPQPAYP